jgi:hypothetical protein
MWDGTKDVRTETIPHSELIYALEIPVGKARFAVRCAPTRDEPGMKTCAGCGLMSLAG